MSCQNLDRLGNSKFETIVVAIDCSAPSLRALEAARKLALAFKGELHPVQALENRKIEVTPDATAWEGDTEARLPTLSKAAAHAASLGVKPETQTVGECEASEEIMTIADLYSADLIVTGRRGMGNLKRLLAGSTSQQIAKSANCAVLTIKNQTFGKAGAAMWVSREHGLVRKAEKLLIRR